MPVYFYTNEKPNRKIEGALFFDNEGFTATLATPLFPFKQIEVDETDTMVSMAFSSDPKKISDDYLPRIVAFSDTEKDIKGLLLDAHASVHHAGIFDPPGQKFTGHRWITSEYSIFNDVKVTGLTAHFNVKRTSATPDATSTANVLGESGEREELQIASVPTEENLLGFSFKLSTSAGLGWWMTHVIRPVESLLKIATVRPVSVSRMHIDTQYGDAKYNENSFQDTRVKRSHLMDPADVTTENINIWLKTAQQLGQVHYYVSGDTINIQADALLYTSALEGIHRRLIQTKSNPRKLSSSEKERLGKAIREKVRETYAKVNGVDENEIAKEASPYASMIQDPSYKKRAAHFIDNYFDNYPFLFGSNIDKWLSDVTNLRNNESHLFAKDDDLKVNIESEYATYLTYHYSLGILLKIVMLDLAGFERNLLQTRIAESEYIGLQLSALDSEEYWHDFSALGAYKEWKKKVKE